MSAKDRAFSRLDREQLQEALEAPTDLYGERNTWATRFRISRESKLVYLDELFSDLDLGAITSALNGAILNPGKPDQPLHIACSKVSAGLLGKAKLYEKPQQVKQRAPQIKALIVEGYQELEGLGYGIPKQTNDSQ
jgi:hypothetical protein